jgi:asparagine synthase (glutamine-hydrolysing)
LALDLLRHRGPDTQGEYADDQVWLGHTRLTILDLSDAGRQPMTTTDGRYVICYNGEVYNYADLAGSLSLNHLASSSDTEVVLRAFAARGVHSFRLLNGIFAFAIYDKQTRKLFLVRDRLGVKPLYFRMIDEGLSFSSEIKPLLAMGDEPAQCDRSALHEWLYYGTSLGARTLYRGIHKLLPGHYAELELATFAFRQVAYWSPTELSGLPKNRDSLDTKIGSVRSLLEQAVERQLVSDVPVGVFLSGGIDSSAVTAFASRHYAGKLATYSVGFDFDKGVNELPTARNVAKLYGTDHHELHVVGVDIGDVVKTMVGHHGMPFSDAANIPLYLLSSRIKDTTKVVLQGDGGDEVFGGYSRYATLSRYRMARVLAKIAGVANELTPRGARYYRVKRYVSALAPRDPVEVMALLLTEEDVNANPEAVFDPGFRDEVIRADPFTRFRECQALFKNEDLVNQMLFVDAMIILPDIFLEKVDRATMAASVEARVPFLDNDLVEFCLRLSGTDKVRNGAKKWLLKKALEGIVPDAILSRRKTGFGVPYGHWLRAALKPLFFDELATFERRYPNVLDTRAVAAMHQAHATQRRDRSFLLWKVLNFTIWANGQPAGFAL